MRMVLLLLLIILWLLVTFEMALYQIGNLISGVHEEMIYLSKLLFQQLLVDGSCKFGMIVAFGEYFYRIKI